MLFSTLSISLFLEWMISIFEFKPVFLQPADDTPIFLFQFGLIFHPFGLDGPTLYVCYDFDHIPSLCRAHISSIVIRFGEYAVWRTLSNQWPVIGVLVVNNRRQ